MHLRYLTISTFDAFVYLHRFHSGTYIPTTFTTTILFHTFIVPRYLPLYIHYLPIILPATDGGVPFFLPFISTHSRFVVHSGTISSRLEHRFPVLFYISIWLITFPFYKFSDSPFHSIRFDSTFHFYDSLPFRSTYNTTTYTTFRPPSTVRSIHPPLYHFPLSHVTHLPFRFDSFLQCFRSVTCSLLLLLCDFPFTILPFIHLFVVDALVIRRGSTTALPDCLPIPVHPVLPLSVTYLPWSRIPLGCDWNTDFTTLPISYHHHHRIWFWCNHVTTYRSAVFVHLLLLLFITYLAPHLSPPPAVEFLCDAFLLQDHSSAGILLLHSTHSTYRRWLPPLRYVWWMHLPTFSPIR